MDKIEKILKTAARSQEFIDDDRLAKTVKKFDNYELSEDDLELVAAAGTAEYSQFLNYIESHKKGL